MAKAEENSKNKKTVDTIKKDNGQNKKTADPKEDSAIKKTEDKKTAPPKKKKKGCCGCLVSILVFVLVINIAGFFIGDYYAKQMLGVTLIDCFKIIGNLGDVKEDKVVTNPYSEDDLSGINTEFKKQLFLKDSVAFDAVELIVKAMDAFSETPAEEETGGDKNGNGVLATANTPMTNAIHMLNDNGVDETPNAAIEYITNLYLKENLDLDRLKNYKESNHDTDYVLKIRDKEFAALLNAALDMIIQDPKLSEELQFTELANQLGFSNLKEVISLKQVVFENLSTESGDVPTLKVTLGISTRKIVMKLLENNLQGMPVFLVRQLIPQMVYVSAQVSLDANIPSLEAPVIINAMSTKQMDDVYKIVGSITEIINDPIDLRAIIDENIELYIGGALQLITNSTGIISVADHTIPLDLFETVINVSGLNEGAEEDKKLTGRDIIRTLSGIVSSNADAAINSDHAWDEQYLIDNVIVHKPANITGGKLIDYKQEFMNEIAAKYMLDFSGANKEDPSDDIKFEDVIALFGIGESDGEKNIELLDLLDVSKLNQVVGLPTRSVNINDRMLGAILDSQISTLISAEGSMADMSPKLEHVILTKKSFEGKVHHFIEMGLSVNVSALLDGAAGGMGQMISNIIGEKIVLVVKMDITPSVDETFVYQKTQVRYNDLDDEKTQKILQTVSKFGVEFNLDEITAQLETPVRDAINSMSDVLPVKLQDSTIDYDETGKKLPAAIELPSVFETIDKMLFADDEGDVITPQGIEDVLLGIDKVNEANYESNTITNPAGTNYDKFMADIENKFYIMPQLNENGEKIPLTFDRLFGDNSIVNSSAGFDVKNFDFNSKNGLFYDTRSSDDLKPLFYDSELAAMIVDKMNESGGFGDMLNIRELTIGADKTISLIIEVDFTSFLGDANTDKIDLLPAEKMFVRANIQTDNVLYYDKVTNEDVAADDANATAYYPTSVNINSMNEDVVNVLNAMLKHLNGGSAQLDLHAKAKEIGSLVYDNLKTLQDSVGGEIEFVRVTKEDGNQQGALKIISFYDFLKIALALDDGTSTANIKMTLQGLMAYDAAKPNDNNYKVEDIVVSSLISSETEVLKHFVIKDIDIIQQKATAYATDMGLGSVLSKQVNSDKFMLEQFNIIGSDDAIHLARLGEYAQEGYTTYLEFTFKMAGFGGVGSLASVIPESIYVSIIIPYDNAKSGTVEAYGEPLIKLNNLSLSNQQLLMNMITENGTNDDISAQFDVVIDALNKQCPNAKFYAANVKDAPAEFNEFNNIGIAVYTQQGIF